MRVVPPWATKTPAEKQEQAWDIVQAKWYDLKGFNANIYGAPIYSNTTKHEPQGNLWRCDRLEPVPIGLAPYYGTPIVGFPSSTLYQTLNRHVATFKPQIS